VVGGVGVGGVSLPAKTIHGLLGVKANGDDGFGFQHDQTNPLPHKFVLMDEASMKDVPLFAATLQARSIGTHYLILGDPNQLAPVGHGAPLRDLLRCPDSVPAGTLSEIRRNSGRGVQVCAAIRDKKPWTCSPRLDLENGENLLLVDAANPAAQIEALERMIRSFRDKPRGERKYDPIWDVQVICAVNKKGELSRKILNELLQRLLNPDGATIEKCPFRIRDKIVNTRNGLLKSADPYADAAVCDQDGKVYVANGEQAEVINVEPGVITAKLTSPPRTVLIYRRGKSESQEQAEEAAGGEDAGEENAGDESEGKTATATGCSWDLGYAISAHKSQGSEWPVVIVMLDTDNSARRVCSRQWIYTAISRFKDFALLVGMKKTADAMCGRDALFARKTFLKERIEELKKETDDAERPREPLLLGFDAEPAAEVAFDFDDILEGVL
jgi:ATP-dependent exoDNAse (exonuclease V) alpha subunit